MLQKFSGTQVHLRCGNHIYKSLLKILVKLSVHSTAQKSPDSFSQKCSNAAISISRLRLFNDHFPNLTEFKIVDRVLQEMTYFLLGSHFPHRHDVASISLLCRYFYGNYPNELDSLVMLSKSLYIHGVTSHTFLPYNNCSTTSLTRLLFKNCHIVKQISAYKLNDTILTSSIQA